MIWRISDVNADEEYRVQLCETSNGLRFFRLAVIGDVADSAPPEDVILVTNRVPNEMLRRGDVISISEAISLSNGQPFFVDAHGSWITESESQEMDAGIDFSKINWVNGRVPRFAPR